MGKFFTPPRAFCSRTFGGGLETVRHSVTCAPLKGARAAFLSDIHADRRVSDAQLAALFARVNALEADIAFIGGDFAEDEASLARLLRAMEALRPRRGIYACMGNNDSEIPGFARLVAGRVRLLVNQSERVALGAGEAEVAGVDEPRHGRPDARGLFSPDGAAFRLLLSHYPVAPDYAGAPGADLQLSGHTHGGQFNLLGITPYALLFELRRHAWISGECCIGGARAIVSNGVGMSRVRLRVGARPQIHLIAFED